MKVPEWLKHAFAVDSVEEELTSAQQKVVDRICLEVVRRQLTTPAIAFLEMARPLNYLGAQTMQFFHPIVSALGDAESYANFANFLERRDAIDILTRQIEELEQKATSAK